MVQGEYGCSLDMLRHASMAFEGGVNQWGPVGLLSLLLHPHRLPQKGAREGKIES